VTIWKKVKTFLLLAIFLSSAVDVISGTISVYALDQNDISTVSRTVAYDKNDCSDLRKCRIIKDYINPFIKLLAAIAGISIVIGIIVGGLQYSSSAGDPGKVAAAKKKMASALIALVCFMFLASFIRFVAPGEITGTAPVNSPNAQKCSSSFLGLKPWFAYLPPDKFDRDGKTCSVTNFEFLPKTGMSDLVPVALAIADDLLRIAGLVAVAFVMVGGIKYVTSQGEPDATKQAKDTIINAIIGLLVAMIAVTIVTFIGRSLTQ